jgi:small subunit ribosomal protein S16
VAVKIRLKRMGKIRQPYYRIVVADSRTKRDGRVIEEIGKYHPKEDPSFIEVDSDRVQYWLGVGAQPSEPVAAILKVTGDWQRFKGEPAPEAMKVAEPKRDKTEIFNEALKDSANEPQTAAVTPKKAAAKKAAEQPAAEATAADATAAEATAEAPATEAPAEASESPAEAESTESTDATGDKPEA